MKKLIAVLIIAICSAAFGTVIIVKDKTTIDEKTGSTTTENRVADKVDDQTVRVTTTITTTPAASSVDFDRAVLQTELDHIPDRRAELQLQIDALDEREAELKAMLEVFK